MNCDEYIDNFKSVIQNIQHTKNNNNSSRKESNTNEICNDYDRCYTILKNTWNDIVKYTTYELTHIKDLFDYDYTMNQMFQKKFNDKKTNINLYDRNIENTLIKYYIQLFNNIKPDIRVMITCIEQIFVICFENIKNCDKMYSNHVGVSEIKPTEICLDQNHENHYLNTIILLKQILEKLAIR